MTETTVIPEEYKGAIKRLLNRIPAEQRDDIILQKSLLMYLKLDGEKLARHRLELSRTVFPEQMIFIKKQVRDGVDDEDDEDIDEDNPGGVDGGMEYVATFDDPVAPTLDF